MQEVFLPFFHLFDHKEGVIDLPNPDPKSFEGLYSALKAQLQNNEQHPLLQALNAVNQYITNLRTPDRYKRIPYVTEQNKKDLIELHQRVAEESEKLRKSTNREAVRDAGNRLWQKLSALSAAIAAAPKLQPIAEPKSPQIQLF